MAVAQFTREYTTVRRAEGWGSSEPAYYQALPFQDLTGKFAAIWRIRAQSYTTFLVHVVEPLERSTPVAKPSDIVPDSARALTRLVTGDITLRESSLAGGDDGALRDSRLSGGATRPLREDIAAPRGNHLAPQSTRRRLRILDLGAGNGWLSNRLAQRGHSVTAVDLSDDPLDGLGAARHYGAEFAAVLAEFDHLPLGGDHEVDLAIFNASLHYSTDYARTLSETLRVLQPRGTLVILDSPMYSDPTSGARMVHERQARFLASYGFASDALPSEHFLTPARLQQLSEELKLSWQLHQPALDWRSRIGRSVSGIRAHREPARFPVIVGRCR